MNIKVIPGKESDPKYLKIIKWNVIGKLKNLYKHYRVQ
jgi:hypothetical protein